MLKRWRVSPLRLKVELYLLTMGPSDNLDFPSLNDNGLTGHMWPSIPVVLLHGCSARSAVSIALLGFFPCLTHMTKNNHEHVQQNNNYGTFFDKRWGKAVVLCSPLQDPLLVATAVAQDLERHFEPGQRPIHAIPRPRRDVCYLWPNRSTALLASKGSLPCQCYSPLAVLLQLDTPTSASMS
eukprot:305378-Amphidinium_carterae.2